MSQEIGGIGAKLKSMFQFNVYSIIDSAVMQGVEGLPVSYRLGEEYILTFSIGPAGDVNRHRASSPRNSSAPE